MSQVDAELRETLIQGYAWILVDEYRDIGPRNCWTLGCRADYIKSAVG
ncbi:hypothetical protein FBZ99_11920 [Rhizobium sp. ERR 1071]|nr:hypothetical protein FBZ99_11920 [Rhizobium sp. ERR1071]